MIVAEDFATYRARRGSLEKQFVRADSVRAGYPNVDANDRDACSTEKLSLPPTTTMVASFPGVDVEDKKQYLRLSYRELC